MIYQQALDYLYTRLPMFSRVGPAAYKKDLHNTLALLKAVGNPQNQFKSIHVAGTNGKGSVSHMLASVLQTHGFKTGLYTSPHLFDFRERFKINGRWIDADFVSEFTERCKPLIEEIEPSFFEVTVAMAFSWFAQKKVDYAVIETGLGGRLDSTNVITPVLSVITNIGWDHMNLLGNSLAEIAYEKAGIIKHGVPVVVGETLPETKDVFSRKALQENAPLFFAEEMYSIKSVQQTAERIEVALAKIDSEKAYLLASDLRGNYQQYNLRTVNASLDVLREQGINVSEDAAQKGLMKAAALTGLFGRWQILESNPLVIADVAHNKQGLEQVLAQVEKNRTNQNSQVHFITGMVNDKDVDGALSILPAKYNYYFAQAQIPRAMPAKELQQRARLLNLKGEYYPDVNTSLDAAKKKASPEDLIIICGSIFLVGELAAVREAIAQQQQKLNKSAN